MLDIATMTEASKQAFPAAGTAEIGSIQRNETLSTLRGVVFGKSVRAFYAFFHVATPVEDEALQSHDYVPVRIRFENDELAPVLRSWSRRVSKLGNLLRMEGRWNRTDTEYGFVVRISSLEQAHQAIQVEQAFYWIMPKCQIWQDKYRPKKEEPPSKKLRLPTTEEKASCTGVVTEQHQQILDEVVRHGRGVNAKRQQGECLASFVIHMMEHKLMTKQNGNEASVDSSLWASTQPATHDSSRARKALNVGSAVLDAAGGQGHVSMALGMRGVKSTLIDPRANAGCLPRRDRKVWYRALKKQDAASSKDGDGPFYPIAEDSPSQICQPVTPYSTLRAWFGEYPTGTDANLRHPDQATVPVCSDTDALLQNCSAIVALHPDEATDVIVNIAVKHRIPFVCVPCCVFSKLFPNRRQPNTNNLVCTYPQLLDYLQAKDGAIQRTALPFEGANVALWAVF